MYARMRISVVRTIGQNIVTPRETASGAIFFFIFAFNPRKFRMRSVTRIFYIKIWPRNFKPADWRDQFVKSKLFSPIGSTETRGEPLEKDRFIKDILSKNDHCQRVWVCGVYEIIMPIESEHRPDIKGNLIKNKTKQVVKNANRVINFGFSIPRS